MKALLALSLLALPTGCAATLYDWGSYEASIYRTTGDDGRLEEEIRLLSEETLRTEAEGRKVPPGKWAHLGHLHQRAGDLKSAAACFRLEKERYPESAKFIDGLLGRMP